MIKPLKNGEFLINQLIWNMVFKQGLPDLKKGFCKGHQITHKIPSEVVYFSKISRLQVSKGFVGCRFLPKNWYSEGNPKNHGISMMDIAKLGDDMLH